MISSSNEIPTGSSSNNNETMTCDLLVAGSGAAGFSAALSASLQGLKVLMVEKEPLFGGTTAYSAGVIWIPCNTHAAAFGIKDSRSDALAYLRSLIGNRLDQSKAEAFVDQAHEMLERYESEEFVEYEVSPTWADYYPDEPGGSQGGRSLGPTQFDGTKLGPLFAKLRPPLKTMTVLGGMMVGRGDLPHVFKMTEKLPAAWHVAGMVANHVRSRLQHPRGTRLVNGNALIARLAWHARARGIPLWLEAPVVELISNDSRVTGAVVQRDGKHVRIEAKRGVVLACGGFPGSKELTARIYPHRVAKKNHQRLPPEGNSGDGVRLASGAGGYLNQDVHHPAAWVPVSLVPQADGSTIPYPHFYERGKPGYIAVDRRGRRFTNEARSYHAFVPDMIDACRSDDTIESWIICDHQAIRKFGLGALGPRPMPLRSHLRSGYIVHGATISDLARAAGIDPDGLTKTVSTFNHAAAHGEDPEFHRGTDSYQRFNGAVGHGPNPCVAPIDKGPFYAVRVVPGELGTFAGIATNASGQVVDKSGAPIEGLYAVGNDAASVMGGTYPAAGITIGPAMTFGYIAGRHAAKGA